ncbi:MAG: stage II sporulation protein M [Methanobrevibacter arboriphilus]|uniref:Stage II sporulation protein M n=1 Tax=Methanobrevibacter arboriphilus TaxID=39441 RepID=A0A843AJB9_METAZ|nr:stage II sporulation protein M [Methanobrevibacter arboriphilus]MBF4469296.1 stage II sporulation protein M [Methanobrevibacter arboriphilus]
MKSAFSENKFIILFSTLLFVIPMLFGYFFASYISEAMNPVINSFRERVQQGDIQLTHDSIFFNNVYVGIILYCGAITFGLLTASVLISNGIFIGYFATKMPLYSFLLLTLPHGIFEIPAIIIAGSSGFIMFKFLVEFFKGIVKPVITNDEVRLSVKNRIANSLNNNINRLTQSLVLLGFSVVLFIIAAFIEAYLTIGIARLFMIF